ncbi:MAG: type II toxin-antitoxin system HicA family toxin, partial [Spirochaetales bacterium]|nr:type II toxin-antitoxin system HicA family toxin [Spirochaetales bacterium]
HPIRQGRITVPHPKKNLPIGTVKNILRFIGEET